MAINGVDEKYATEEFFLTMFELYKTTVEKMYGSQYLNAAFFRRLHQVRLAHLHCCPIHVSLFKASPEFRKHLLFIVAVLEDENVILRKHEYVLIPGLGRVVAGTINVVSDTHFYGRYWGAFTFVNNLHFEICYYKVGVLGGE